ncbi:MAG: phosphoribosylaminoimidazolesuccinocarboxamide synthase [Chloroflexi bacterium]|nr:phosphoribosylaminoimidazolesuccinocarboxamide synthase [Chloroflexota bacterium]
MTPLLETNLPNLFYRGKVRDTYDLGQELLIVATDRISAFDSVLPCGIPGKGQVLNQLAAFWFQKTAHLVPNHLVETVDDIRLLSARVPRSACYVYPSYLVGRSMLAKKAQRIDVECVVRGYLSGSAWAEYRESGSICSLPQPAGLVDSQKLPEPLFTPTTKADSGHDQPLSLKGMESLLGRDLARALMHKSLEVYNFAADYALGQGIIIADTKMEFGIIDGRLSLIDELLTPDSSRFWDASHYRPGRSQSSFDKQPVRDWLVQAGWNKEPPAPPLPPEVVAQTSERYRQAYRKLTGMELREMPNGDC